MAAGDLTTLAYVQAYMQNTEATVTAALPPLISAASAFVHTYCSRDFLTTDYNELYDGSGNQTLMLANAPVLSISSVTINGQPVPQSTGWNVVGWVKFSSGVILRARLFPKAKVNVQVQYTAGYGATAADMPDDLQQCIAIMCNIRIKKMPNEDKSSLGILQQTTAFVASELTPYVKQILSQYKPPFKAMAVPA